jgi:hypothetical protein
MEFNAAYKALTTADNEKLQTADVVAIEVIHEHDNVVGVPCARPRYSRQGIMIPGSVTRHEQDMIHLMSTFSATYTTAAGKHFVEHLSRLTTITDFKPRQSLPWGDISRIIMWPTHGPDNTESVNGDFCSDVNWVFAYCLKEVYDPDHTKILYDFRPPDAGSTPLQATIIGSLYPIVPSPNYSKLYSRVMIEKPEFYLKPNGEILQAATAACDIWRRKQQRIGMLGSLFFILFVLVFLLLIQSPDQ